jgi:hypothetical protein
MNLINISPKDDYKGKMERNEMRRRRVPPTRPPSGRTDPPSHLIKLPADSSSRHLSADYSPPFFHLPSFRCRFFLIFSAFCIFFVFFHFLLLAFRRHLAAFLLTNFHFIDFLASIWAFMECLIHSTFIKLN